MRSVSALPRGNVYEPFPGGCRGAAVTSYGRGGWRGGGGHGDAEAAGRVAGLLSSMARAQLPVSGVLSLAAVGPGAARWTLPDSHSAGKGETRLK